MRKNLLMLAVILLTAVMAHAETGQTVTATLNHEGNVATYTGGNGLRDALNAAVDGDAIVLSPGTFNAVDINKVVTLRGAGATTLSMPGDSIKPTEATYITGNLSVNISSTEGQLTIEGCEFNNSVYFSKAPSVDVFKSRFADLTVYKNVASISFTHCLINKFGHDLNEHTTLVNTVAYFTYFNPFINALNCVLIGSYYGTFTYYSSAAGGGQLTNCILTFDKDPGSGSIYLSSNCVAYNCVACLNSSYNRWSSFKDFFKYSYNGTNQVINGVTLFNNEDAVPVYPFYLTEEAQKTYLGNDGTQVGVHGGALPIDPIPDNLLVTKCNIAPKTTPTGKLSIEIQVSTAK